MENKMKRLVFWTAIFFCVFVGINEVFGDDEFTWRPGFEWMSIPVLLIAFVVIPICRVLRKHKDDRRAKLLRALTESLMLSSFALAISSFSSTTSGLNPWPIVVLVTIAAMVLIELYYRFIAPRLANK